MSEQISVLRTRDGDSVAIVSGGVTQYVYAPFELLWREEISSGTLVVIKKDSKTVTFVVNDAESLALLSVMPKGDDAAAVDAALSARARALSGPNPAGSKGVTSVSPNPAAQALTAPAVSPSVAAAVAAWGPAQGGPTPTPPSRPSAARRRAHGAAFAVEVLAWIGAFVGLIAGIAIAAQTEGDGYYSDPSRPNLALGIIIAVVSVVQALPTIMIAAYIQSRTE